MVRLRKTLRIIEALYIVYLEQRNVIQNFGFNYSWIFFLWIIDPTILHQLRWEIVCCSVGSFAWLSFGIPSNYCDYLCSWISIFLLDFDWLTCYKNSTFSVYCEWTQIVRKLETIPNSNVALGLWWLRSCVPHFGSNISNHSDINRLEPGIKRGFYSSVFCKIKNLSHGCIFSRLDVHF